MKPTSQMPSSTSVMPSLWPASTVEMLIFLRCMQMRPHEVTRMSRSWKGYSTAGWRFGYWSHRSSRVAPRPRMLISGSGSEIHVEIRLCMS
jgi:hypothetical protein